jgi:hypothetical protein
MASAVAGGKKQAAAPTEVSSPEPVWQEEAGSLLLLAAAHETGLIETLDAALPLTSATCPTRLAHSTHTSRERLGSSERMPKSAAGSWRSASSERALRQRERSPNDFRNGSNRESGS